MAEEILGLGECPKFLGPDARQPKHEIWLLGFEVDAMPVSVINRILSSFNLAVHFTSRNQFGVEYPGVHLVSCHSL